jgi:hypothetical protein
VAERRVPSEGETNLYLPDSDGDGLSDGIEDANCDGSWDEGGETSCRNRDTDTDRYEDGFEVILGSSDPLDPGCPTTPFFDADGDALWDGMDPDTESADTDSDRFLDGYEAVTADLQAVSDPERFPELGDAHANMIWDNADAQVILNFFSNKDTPLFRAASADLDRNAFIDNADAQRSISYFANQTPHLPAGN